MLLVSLYFQIFFASGEIYVEVSRIHEARPKALFKTLKLLLSPEHTTHAIPQI